MTQTETSLAEKPTDSQKTFHCSFCGKSVDEISKMIAGPTSFICDECILACASIIFHEKDGYAQEMILEIAEARSLRADHEGLPQLAPDDAAFLGKLKELVQVIQPDYFEKPKG